MQKQISAQTTPTQNGPTPPDRTPDPAPRPRFPDWAII